MYQRRTITLILFCVFLLLAFPVFAQDTTESDCADGLHAFDHALGTACVPENPQRVVALEWKYAEDMLALGVQPLAVADIAGYNNWIQIPIALDEDVVDIGTRQEPNLEAIAALNPDLILAVQFRVTENYDELNAIAPTLVFNPYPEDGSSHYYEMLTTFQTIAEALNRTAEAEEVLNHLQAKFDSATTALEEAGRVSEGFILSQGWVADSAATFRLFTDNAMAVQILEQIGLNNIWDDAPQLYGFTTVGIEGFADLADQDFNFFYVAQGEDNEQFVASPIWNSLTFVNNEHDYWMGGDVWLFGGPLSAELLVDTILTAMGVEIPDMPAPTDLACDDNSRSVIDAVGESICVPLDPQRVLALMESDLDALLALGVDPIGTTNGRGQSTPPRYLTDELPADFTIVGDFYRPNLELVLELAPDLILFGGFSDPDVLAQLNEIAPTFNTFLNGESWQSHLIRVGEVMNKQAEANEFIASYEARIAELQGALGEQLDAMFIVSRWSAEGAQVMAPTTFSSTVLLDLGMNPPAEIPELQTGHPHSAPLSLEAIDILDVDWAFIGTLTADGDDVTALEDTIESPLWQTLSVVQNNHVVMVDGSLWTSIGGPLAAMQVLDNVEAAITGNNE